MSIACWSNSKAGILLIRALELDHDSWPTFCVHMYGRTMTACCGAQSRTVDALVRCIRWDGNTRSYITAPLEQHQLTGDRSHIASRRPCRNRQFDNPQDIGTGPSTTSASTTARSPPRGVSVIQTRPSHRPPVRVLYCLHAIKALRFRARSLHHRPRWRRRLRAKPSRARHCRRCLAS